MHVYPYVSFSCKDMLLCMMCASDLAEKQNNGAVSPLDGRLLITPLE